MASTRTDRLILDFDLYPRQSIDPVNVRTIARAIDAGETLPPVIADRSSKRVVDGFHRVTEALRRSADSFIEVEWQHYETDNDLFLDSVRRNARHGLQLSAFDRARSCEIAERLGITIDITAAALAVSVDILGELRARKIAYNAAGDPVVIKRTISHLAGGKLTEKQERANRRSGGMTVRFYAEQVINALQGDVVPWDDPSTVASLTLLAKELQTHKSSLREAS